ncbi:MAG: 16S rRNA (guanine(966)-N(2))-methyltransferase RsmD [Pseudomonadota bacterium]
MRIIAGSKKGTKLAGPGGRKIRPTPDMVRESLFNILGQVLSGMRFLDLYAGTGAVGLEAVSRGADACVLVDKSSEAVALCRKNSERLLLAEKVRIMHMDVMMAVERIAAKNLSFDIIFAGPPFDESTQVLERLAGKIAGSAMLRGGGMFVIQLPATTRDFSPGGMVLTREKKYGRNKLLFFLLNSPSNLGDSPVY